jgi:hypothetical protein
MHLSTAKLGRGTKQIAFNLLLIRAGSDLLTAIEPSKQLKSTFGIFLASASIIQDTALTNLNQKKLNLDQPNADWCYSELSFVPIQEE